MTKEQNSVEHREAGSLQGKDLREESFVPEGGWVYVDPALSWEERTTQFPLGKNQLYKFGEPPAAEVKNQEIEAENPQPTTPAV